MVLLDGEPMAYNGEWNDENYQFFTECLKSGNHLLEVFGGDSDCPSGEQGVTWDFQANLGGW
jgi:hypothetical protein